MVLFAGVIATMMTEVIHGPLPDSADTFLIMGYAKAIITFTKYLPQVYLNWKRKSTVGWSLENVLLDFAGGSLSFAQSALLTIALGDPFFGAGAFNLVKFILSITSILFDSIFMFQHWVLYRNSHTRDADKSIMEDSIEP